VDKRALGESQTWGHIAGHAEIWILIDGARNKAMHLFVAEDEGEGAGDSWCSLGSRKANLANNV